MDKVLRFYFCSLVAWVGVAIPTAMCVGVTAACLGSERLGNVAFVLVISAAIAGFGAFMWSDMDYTGAKPLKPHKGLDLDYIEYLEKKELGS